MKGKGENKELEEDPVYRGLKKALCGVVGAIGWIIDKSIDLVVKRRE